MSYAHVSKQLPSVVHHVAKQGLKRIEQCDSFERGELRIEIAQNLVRELVMAYSDQRRGLGNFRLTIDDIEFARRWLGWQRYKVALAQWLLDPEHAAAWAALETNNGQVTLALSDAIRGTLQSRPLAVPQVNLEQAPDGWPRQILSWSEAVETIIAERWTHRREPGWNG